MPEALVNMFIHMGICKTERVAWALKLSSFHLQERRDGKCRQRHKMPFIPHLQSLTLPQAWQESPKPYCMLTHHYRVAISQISATIKGFVSAVMGPAFSESISYFQEVTLISYATWDTNALTICFDPNTCENFFTVPSSFHGKRTPNKLNYAQFPILFVCFRPLDCQSFLCISLQFLRQKCQQKSLLFFKEALLISAQAILGNYLEVSWERWKMAPQWLFSPALNFPPTSPDNVRGKRETESPVQRLLIQIIPAVQKQLAFSLVQCGTFC